MPERFGEMLLTRRRHMGLSIQQVANTIKIRPQIIEYFETEDFSSMPPRGYAQGMISSYARYLGLNPRQVVDAYFAALSRYERESGRGAGRYQEAAGFVSPHGSNADGRYYMVGVAPASSRFGARPPQAGYVSESTSMHEPASATSMRLGARDEARAGRRLPARSGGDRGDRSLSAGRSSMRGQGRDSGRPRARRANSVDAASRRQGSREQPSRLSARTVSPQRGGRAQAPGPSRRQGAAPRPRGSGPARQRSGYRGRRGSAPAAPGESRLLMGAFGAIAILLVLVIVLLVRSCGAGAAPAQSTPAASKVASQTTAGSGSSAATASSDATSTDASSSDAAATASDASSTGDAASKSENAQPVVKVSLPKGKTSWIEVKLDGKIVYSDSATGPFSQEYTVTSSIEISVTKPGDVTVTKDGERVRYDTKSSGVGKVTIAAPVSAESSQPADASSEQAQQQSTDQTQAAAASQAASSASTATNQVQ